MNTKTWVIFGVICVALFSGLIYISKKNQISVDVSKLNENSILAASAQNGNIADHVDGNTSSKVTMIEYGDFQCPYCGQAYPGMKQVVTDYKNKITFIFRNFPLTSMHPNALAAATAAEAAGLQGKYWEMFNKLYENQSGWSNLTTNQRTSTFTGYAKLIGIDESKFKANLEEKSVATKIGFDQALGKKINVTGTPSIYINGKKISDDAYSKLVGNDTTALRALLDEQLK